MKTIRSPNLVLFVIAMSLFLLEASRPLFAQQTILKVATIPITASLPLFATMDKGFFAEQGIKLETNFMAGGAVIMPALLGGSIDLGHSAVAATIIAKDKGFDVKIVANSNNNVTLPSSDPPGYKGAEAILVPRGSRIESAKDLEGKKIATNTRNSPLDILFKEWMVKKGADPKGVHWVEVPFPQMGAVLTAGSVDAILQAEPFTTILLGRGEAKFVAWFWSEVRREFTISGYVATGPWLKKNPEVADRFFKAFAKGTDYINSRPEERGSIVVKNIRMDPELAKKIVYHAYSSKQDVDSLQWWADLLLKQGLLSKPMDVNVLIHDTAR